MNILESSEYITVVYCSGKQRNTLFGLVCNYFISSLFKMSILFHFALIDVYIQGQEARPLPHFLMPLFPELFMCFHTLVVLKNTGG